MAGANPKILLDARAFGGHFFSFWCGLPWLCI
jgi:hypothetical protein